MLALKNYNDKSWFEKCILRDIPKWLPDRLHERFVCSKMNLFRYCYVEKSLDEKSTCEQIEMWIRYLVAYQSTSEIRQWLGYLDTDLDQDRFIIAKVPEEDRIPPPETIVDLCIVIYVKRIATLEKKEGLKACLEIESKAMLWNMIF